MSPPARAGVCPYGVQQADGKGCSCQRVLSCYCEPHFICSWLVGCRLPGERFMKPFFALSASYLDRRILWCWLV